MVKDAVDIVIEDAIVEDAIDAVVKDAIIRSDGINRRNISPPPPRLSTHSPAEKTSEACQRS